MLASRDACDFVCDAGVLVDVPLRALYWVSPFFPFFYVFFFCFVVNLLLEGSSVSMREKRLQGLTYSSLFFTSIMMDQLDTRVIHHTPT